MQKVFVLRTESFPSGGEALLSERLKRWGISAEVRVADQSRGSLGLTASTDEGVDLQVRSEAKYRYPVLLLAGPDDQVADLARRIEPDVWSRDELLLEVTATDPPDASLLVPLALTTEELDEVTVEVLLRALEADAVEHRRQALVAISMVPALAFMPALTLNERREPDPELRAMTRRVISMCGG